MIQLFKHHVYPEAIEKVTEVLQSGWTGLGDVVEEFETRVKEYLDTPFAVGFNSGTGALLSAICFFPDKGKGNYVITTPLTFISTNHSILQHGFLPVFADIEPDTGNISAESVAKLLDDKFIKDRTKGIIVVHYGGQPVNQDAIYDIANAHNFPIIEDAAHAFGAEYMGSKIGCRHSSMVAFSFHAVKPLALGDGGLLATPDPYVYTEAKKLRWCGINKSTAERTAGEGYHWGYNVEHVGFKTHMNNIQAAIGLGQLLHVQEDWEHRHKLCELYDQLLADVPQVSRLTQYPERKSAHHLYVIKVDTARRDELMAHLAAQGIQTGCHYKPSHLYNIYRIFETDSGCQEATKFYNQAITLPLHVELTTEDVGYVCEKVKGFFKDK